MAEFTLNAASREEAEAWYERLAPLRERFDGCTIELWQKPPIRRRTINRERHARPPVTGAWAVTVTTDGLSPMDLMREVKALLFPPGTWLERSCRQWAELLARESGREVEFLDVYADSALRFRMVGFTESVLLDPDTVEDAETDTAVRAELERSGPERMRELLEEAKGKEQRVARRKRQGGGGPPASDRP